MTSPFDMLAGTLVRDSIMSFFAEADAASVEYLTRERDTYNVLTTLRAILGPIEERKRQDERGIAVEYERAVRITDDPNSEWGGVLTPHVGDALRIDEEIWVVRGKPHHGSGLVELNCLRVGRCERTGAGYRARS